MSGTITVPNTGTAAAPNNRENIIKNCAPFTDCKRKLNNTQIYNAKHIDAVKSMYNLVEYSDNYSKTSPERLWQYYRDEPALDNNGNIVDFPAPNNNGASFIFKQKNSRQSGQRWQKKMFQ